MSNYYREIWPLAFVLAMASGSSSQGDTPIDTDPSVFFRAGSLADTFRNTLNAGEGSADRSGIRPIQLSQWFNFANCFSGVWRRC
jgi:hypothetical protein